MDKNIGKRSVKIGDEFATNNLIIEGILDSYLNEIYLLASHITCQLTCQLAYQLSAYLPVVIEWMSRNSTIGWNPGAFSGISRVIWQG
jgi:hypothetical protein